MNLSEKEQTMVQKNWKFYLGIGFLVCSGLFDLAFLIVPFLGLSGAKIISSLAAFAVFAELFFLLSILLLGKIVIQKIKEKFKAWFRFKKQESAAQIYIGKRRHYTGVLLFFLSFITYPIIEISLLFGLPSKAQHINFFLLILAGDILFIISLFVLGEPFWEKMKYLFKWTEPPNNNIKYKNEICQKQDKI